MTTVVFAGNRGVRATFEVVPGSSEAIGVQECWRTNDYRVPRAGFRGTIVDVGANIGAFSVLVAMADDVKVHAFEPHPGNRARLEYHLARNSVADRVIVHPEAVGEKTGDTVWIVGDGGGAHVADEGDIAVQTVSLADVLADVGPVDFLKHDAEGAEWQSYESVTSHVLHEQVRRMALEFHGPLMGPHLAHLGADGHYIDRWHRLVEMLADCGRLEISGHPTVGGLMHWAAY